MPIHPVLCATTTSGRPPWGKRETMEGDVRFLPVDCASVGAVVGKAPCLSVLRFISLCCSRASAPTLAAACRCVRACTGTEPTLTHMRKDWPHRCHACKDRNAATSAPGLCFEWPSSHLSARLPCAGDSYLSTSRYVGRRNLNNKHRCVWYTGPSFTPSTTHIAAMTASPPSSNSTRTGVRWC